MPAVLRWEGGFAAKAWTYHGRAMVSHDLLSRLRLPGDKAALSISHRA